MDLAFLVNILCYLDRLTRVDPAGYVLKSCLTWCKAFLRQFVNKLKRFKVHIQKGDLMYIPTLLKASGQVSSATLNKNRDRYATVVKNFHESFVTWFHDLQLKNSQIMFLVDPIDTETCMCVCARACAGLSCPFA